MRLEFLFDQYWYARRHLGDGDAPGLAESLATHPERLWAARASVHALLDLVHVIGQTDLRPELTRELTELLTRRTPDGDEQGTAHASRLQAAVEDLKGLARYPTVPLRNHEMLGALISRMGVAGGSTPFDMPQFQRWLGGTGTAGGIETDLDGWMGALGPLDDAVHAWLGALRASAPWDDAVTTDGAFMHRPPVAHVLLRVRPRLDTHYPEISAGRHRYHIRFLDPKGFATRPVAVTTPVAFSWQACL